MVIPPIRKKVSCQPSSRDGYQDNLSILCIHGKYIIAALCATEAGALVNLAKVLLSYFLISNIPGGSYHTWVKEKGASENTCRHLASLRKCFKFDNYNIKNYSKKEKVTSPRKVYINVEDAQRNMRSLLWEKGRREKWSRDKRATKKMALSRNLNSSRR